MHILLQFPFFWLYSFTSLQGPRQDAGLEGGPDPGVALAIQIYNYCKVLRG